MGMDHPWHTLSVDNIASIVDVDLDLGLSIEESHKRLLRLGPNQLEEGRGPGVIRLFLKQFLDFMVIILIGALAISVVLGELLDALAIFLIVMINAVLGFIQEYKAERSLDVLRQMTAPKATVRRQRRPMRIAATDIVVGDVLILKEGDRVPADARLIRASALKIDESPLTGESHPVNKDVRRLSKISTELADRKNMIYMGTTVVRGRCEAVVVATGMKTEIGDIATLISGAGDTVTPLQRRLDQLGKGLVIACVAVVAAVFGLGVLRGFDVFTMFLTGVSLAVAAIPEGLPAVVTIALALGVQRMIKRNAIVRKLPAVETLGCTTIICSDKTGTLTKNEMTVTKLYVEGRTIDVTGVGYDPEGTFIMDDRPVDLDRPALRKVLEIASHCNDAMLFQETQRSKPTGLQRTKGWRIVGDPTEGALKVLARKGGFDTSALYREQPRIGEIPFDSDRKRMSVVVESDRGYVAYVKGAPDVIVDRCVQLIRRDTLKPIRSEDKTRIRNAAEAMARDALRVLALAYRPVRKSELNASTQRNDDSLPPGIEEQLIFVGLVGMIDSPRPEAARAVMRARRAGVDTMMVTGDHPQTAMAIGKKLGIDASSVVSGRQLDAMDDEALAKVIRSTRIFARVSPRHKLRIVRALKQQGHVVSMTGDGVNDAPAVKEADIGIAMGQSGTDVTREAADMVLADDNFTSIVSAIEEGRGIYDNVRKFIRYLLACNTGEVLAMFIATFFSLPLPLLPIQILWVNLVTDGLPAIALGVDPPEKDIMQRPPRDPHEGVFARGLHLKIMLRGSLIGICTVLVYLVGTWTAPDHVEPIMYARTLALTTLVMSQLVFVFQCRSERRSIHQINLWENQWLLLAVAGSILMHLAVIYLPAGRALMRTVPLGGLDWLIVLSFSVWSQVVEMIAVEIRRVIVRRFSYVKA